MVSCKRDAHFLKKCGFVQEGHTFPGKKTWFRVRGAHLYRKDMVSCRRGTLLSKQYGFVQEGHTFIEKPPKAHAPIREQLAGIYDSGAGIIDSGQVLMALVLTSIDSSSARAKPVRLCSQAP